MRTIKYSSYIVSLYLAQLLFPLNVLSQSTTHYASKEFSSFQYHLKHPFHEVEATCKDFTCTIQYEDATRTILSTSFIADVTSFDSGNSNRDSHAMETLDALTYPTVAFECKNLQTRGSRIQVKGNLTFHGITKPISFSAICENNGNKLTVGGETAVSLTAFQIERPSLLFIPVEDTLRISFTMIFPLSR